MLELSRLTSAVGWPLKLLIILTCKLELHDHLEFFVAALWQLSLSLLSGRNVTSGCGKRVYVCVFFVDSNMCLARSCRVTTHSAFSSAFGNRSSRYVWHTSFGMWISSRSFWLHYVTHLSLFSVPTQASPYKRWIVSSHLQVCRRGTLAADIHSDNIVRPTVFNVNSKHSFSTCDLKYT